jgi:polyketide biosynthesis 3-hydroxy-3-methylglutaryl-CoA synthase-like enzyme PksG
MTHGIDDIGVWAGRARIDVADLFAGRGLDPARIGNLEMRSRSVGLPWEDPVTNAVNAARPVLERLDPADRDRIELLVTSTESGVDYSKSVASYVHRHLGLSSECRVLEAKQACYAATGVLQLAAGYLASGASPGALALVVATDVAVVDARAAYAEPATGHGAVALLLTDDPRLFALDPGAFGLCANEMIDSARPRPDYDIADVDQSLFAYLDGFKAALGAYLRRVPDADPASTFDYFAMHTPFAGIVRAAHRSLARPDGVDAAADYDRRVAPGLVYPSQTGNLCSGSVYLALASLADHAEPGPARVGMYSYGSGSCAEFFSGVLRPRADTGVQRHLDARRRVDFAEYERLLARTLDTLVPHENRDVDLTGYESGEGPELLFTGVKSHHRQYEWS